MDKKDTELTECCWENCNVKYKEKDIYSRSTWHDGEYVKHNGNYEGPTKCARFDCDNTYCKKHSLYLDFSSISDYCYDCIEKHSDIEYNINTRKYVRYLRMLKEEKILLINKIKKLKEEILHLKYKPSGEGAKEAQKHFEELAGEKN